MVERRSHDRLLSAREPREDADPGDLPGAGRGRVIDASRADLLSGTHSLWYEYTCLELHQALADLDEALTAVPEPIRVAINAELETEARQLSEALAEYSEGTSAPETDGRRSWDFGQPFVTYDGGVDMLSREAREQLDRLEEGITPEEREEAVANLRVLVTACSRFPDMLGGWKRPTLRSSLSRTIQTGTTCLFMRRSPVTAAPIPGTSRSAAGYPMTPMRTTGIATARQVVR